MKQVTRLVTLEMLSAVAQYRGMSSMDIVRALSNGQITSVWVHQQHNLMRDLVDPLTSSSSLTYDNVDPLGVPVRTKCGASEKVIQLQWA